MRPVLLISERSDLAADLLVLAARDRNIPVVRWNRDEFPIPNVIDWPDSGPIRLRIGDCWLTENDIAGAWFRRPAVHAVAADPAAIFAARESEAFLAGVWETTSWFWMNRPSAAARAELKLVQLRLARSIGFAVPETHVTNHPAAARDFAAGRRVVAKTLAGGRLAIDGAARAVFTTKIDAADLDDAASIQASPAIFQARIETAFDLRATVIGTQVFAVRILLADRANADTDWRRADPNRIRYESHPASPAFEARCTRLVEALGLSYGALDFVVTPDGETVFLELNPAGQWGWIERASGLKIADAMLDTLREERR